MNLLFTLIPILMTTLYEMPRLPYATDALEPVISRQTMECHYGKHLKTYVDNLNNLVVGTPYEGKRLKEIVATAPDGPLCNNAGQVLNHTLYFEQLSPAPRQAQPDGRLAELIDKRFGSFEQFRQEFTAAATGLFGSGWAFLSIDKEGELHITRESNGGNPLRSGLKPLLCFDVWEHAYYLDYQNRRADHLRLLWSLIDWDCVARRLGK